MLKNKNRIAHWGYLLLLLLLISYRITIGVDFSDESYYATFLDGWFKSGMGHSSNLMLHQTAAWIIYPFASIYHWAVGNNLGLILFLRVLYVILSFVAMLSFFYLSKRITFYSIAVLSSSIVFLFIPWSLPTASYNTLGMLGMLMSLCLFGIIILDEGKAVGKWMLSASCLLWAIAIIAYPTLITVLLFFLINAYFFLSKECRPLLLRYTLICFSILVILSILLILSLGIQHLKSMLVFTNAVNHVSDGLGRKFLMIQQFFTQNKAFALLSGLALALGIGKTIFHKNSLIFWLSYFFLAGVFYFCLFTQGRVLFLWSHDFIFIIALMGIFIPLQTIFYRSYPSVLALLYCTSLFAALITTMTAYNNLYNFHLGGLLAACLSLALMTPKNRLSQRIHFFCTIASLLMANLVMLASDYRYIYGEILNPLHNFSFRIKDGVFAGLLTNTTKGEQVNKIQEILPQNDFSKSLVVFGSGSAPYILTSSTPKTLVTWSWEALQGNTVEKLIHNFYLIKENRPYFIFKINNPAALPLTQTQQRLIKNYHLVKELNFSDTQLQLYAMN